MVKQKLIYGNSYAAIEFAEDNCFYVLQLVRKKKSLSILKRAKVNTLENALVELGKQNHVFLIFNDKQVLTKKINSPKSDDKVLIRKAFSNLNSSDFFYQIYNHLDTNFVSVVRKEYVLKIIDDCKKLGVYVVDFALGNLAVQGVTDYIKTDSIFTSNAKINVDESNIISITKQKTTEKKHIVNGLEVSNYEVLALSGIISYYSKQSSSKIEKELNDAYFQKQFFAVGLKFSLGFLLSILLLNFFIFSNYRSKVGNLSAELEMSSMYKNQLVTIKEEISQKKQLVESLLSNSDVNLSFYLDEIGISSPKTVLLTSITYQPILGTQKKEKPINIDKNTIVVTGTTKDNEAFSSWISSLELKEWISKITIQNNGKDKKRGASSSFEFIIQTND